LKGKKKAELVGITDQLKVSSVGSVQAIKSRIEEHLKKIEQKYEGLSSHIENIFFPEDDTQPFFESMVCMDNT